MPKPQLPVVKNILFGELDYADTGFPEPAVEDDRVCFTIAVRLKKKYSSEDFSIRLVDVDSQGLEHIYMANNGDSKAIKSNQARGKYLHFPIDNLPCKTTFRYEILYQGNPLMIKHVAGQKARQDIVIRTPPARQDPQPIKIAVGGDQERHEQLGPLGRLFDLNNLSHTQLLYNHMANEGNFEASAEDEISEQPYQLFIHLGDLFNGEYFFSLKNLFRQGRRLFEAGVNSLSGFRYHLVKDFGNPVSNNLAHMAYGFYHVVDDHDTGKNDANPPKTKKEYRRQRNMESAFHEITLLPKFLSQPNEAAGRAGPYYKKRIGQSEFFFLHNRYTKDETKEDAYLLGEEQWQWLEDSLANSKASNKVIISPLPFVMGKNPTEDYRAHWQEWHRFMQLCRKYQVSTLLTADSHNYSHSEIHVREHPENKPWVVNQHLIGTLGGSKQFICEDEMQQINTEGRPPMLPKGEGFDASLYAGSTVRAYFSPGSNQALLPSNGLMDESLWSEKKEWHKNTHAYAGMVFSPLFESALQHAKNKEENNDEELEIEDRWQEATQAQSWQMKSRLFTCTGKQKVVKHEERLDCEYSSSLGLQ